jgi:hypothetical protein
MSIAGPTSTLVSAQIGMARGVARLDRAAAEIAKGNVGVEPFIDMMLAEKEVAHAARVVRTADEMHKSLLDILA